MGLSGRSRTFCTDRNMAVGLYPGGNVHTETERETENGRRQKRTADCSRIPLLQSHVKNYVKLEIYDPLWVFLEPSWTFWLSKMGQICCPETSVRNYHYAVRNIPEERRSHLHRGGSLKSRIHENGIRNFLNVFTRRSELTVHELNYGSGVMLRQQRRGLPYITCNSKSCIILNGLPDSVP